METFNIFGQIRGELDYFFNKKIKIAETILPDGKRKGGYYYSQWETLQNIEFVDNSKFITGDKDSEGQTKFFLNTASFRKEVASKNIALGVKNFNFVPEEGQPEEPVIIARKKFRKWAKDNELSEKINETEDRFPKYGTIVAKRCGDEIEIVPLTKLRNEHDAKCLDDSKFVIEEHAEMDISEMEEYPDWDLTQLDLKWNETVTVYERYGRVPIEFFNNHSKTQKPEKKNGSVYCMVIATLDKGVDGGGAVLFIEETESPYIEKHYAKQDGRWLGIGEIEKQIDNQAARNMIFNLRKKALAWSAKNIFQYGDDTLVNNLVMQVKDGDVLKSTPNSRFERVDTTNKANVDFNSIDSLVENNSNQRSFTFEIATGETMPSNTPFRLGAILDNSVSKYYDKKREQLGLFWKQIVFDFMIPQWIEETEEEFIEGVLDTEEGFDELRRAKRELLITQGIVNAVLASKHGEEIDVEAIKNEVDDKLSKINRDYYKMTKKEIKDLKYRLDLDITGESIDMPKKMETLTNFWSTQMKEGDIEGAKATMRRILMLAGEKMPASSKSSKQMPPMDMTKIPANAGGVSEMKTEMPNNQMK